MSEIMKKKQYKVDNVITDEDITEYHKLFYCNNECTI